MEYAECSWFTKPVGYIPEGKKNYKITDMKLSLNNQVKHLYFKQVAAVKHSYQKIGNQNYCR